jgi:hypothetical protein
MANPKYRTAAESARHTAHEAEELQQPQVETRSNRQRVIRYATKEEAEKAHRKVMKVHAGLLRRLAQ